MPSTYSTNLRLELIATGEKSGTWGTTTNVNLGTLIEEAVGGYVSISMTDADYTLTTNNGSSDEARNATLKLNGSLSTTRNVICPAIEKTYLVWNATNQSIIFKCAATSGVTILSGSKALVFVDGTTVRDVISVPVPVALGGTGAATASDARTALGVPGLSSANTFTSNQIISVSSSSDALRITQTGAGNALVVEDSANPDATPFVIGPDGRVFIGNSASLPAGEAWMVQVQGTTVAGVGLSRFTDDTSASVLSFVKSRGSTVGTYGTVVVDGDQIGTLRFAADDGTTALQAATITARVDGTPGTNDMPGRLVFSTTADGASSPSERFRINSFGALGVGGANFGTSGQVLMSGGSAAAPSWGTLSVSGGGTGATDAATARTNLGLAIGTNVQAYDATLQSLSALGTAADRYAYTTGVDTWAEGTITAAGRAILDDADASAQRTTLGLGTAATLNVGTSANNVVQLDGTAKLPAVDGSQLTNLPATFSMPSGSVMPYAGATEPSGWLFCYGQAVSRTTYAALFAVLGTTYGVGDGSTTFNIPDIRGRVIAGQDDMGGTSANRLTNQSGGVDGDVLGAAGGVETHTLTIAQIPSHNHTSFGPSGSGSFQPGGSPGESGTSSSTGFTGGGGAHNNVQPTLILNYIIKT